MALKSLLRAPLKTLLTFLLIAAASFALFSRVTDYAVTTRETRNAKNFYHGVASLDNEVPDITIETKHVQSPNGWATNGYGVVYETEDKPWPAKEELKEFTSLPGVTLADTRYWTAGLVEDYDCLLGGTDHVLFEGTYNGYIDDEEDPYILEDHVCLKFDDVKVIAGREEGMEEGTSIVTEHVALGEMYYARSSFTRAFYDSLKKGSRCLVLAANQSPGGERSGVYFFPEYGLDALRVIDGVSDNYLETESFARQKGWADAINYNLRAYEIGYTSDMRAIPKFNDQRLEIVEGRLLAAGDTDGCVVSESFLKMHGLSVGDSISIQLADVPTDHAPVPNDFSVFVEDASDIEAFHEAAEEFAERLDLDLEFSDRGWLDVKDSFEMGAFTSLLTTVLYIAGAVLALFLAVFLYIGRNKKTYAVMRMLGVPGKSASNSVLLPFAAVAVFAVAIGGSVGLYYAQGTAAKALARMKGSMPIGYVPDAKLSAGTVILCLVLELLFVSISAYFFLGKMKKTPPLELLHEGVRRRAVAGKMLDISNDAADIPFARFDAAKLSACKESIPRGSYGPVRHTAAYIWRHMRRAVGKTALSFVLAIVLAAGIGTMVLARITYKDAFYELGVKCTASDFIFNSVKGLSDSPLVKDFYCYDNFGVRIKGEEENINILMTITSDLARNLGDDCAVEYISGFDISSFEGTAQICLVGEELAGELNISPGDEIGILSDFLYTMLDEQSGEAVTNAFKMYKVIGVIDSEDANVRNRIFAGINTDLTKLYSMDFPIEHCEFTLADNDRLDELKERMKQIQGGSVMYSVDVSYHIDAGGLANIERIRRLLESLFSLAVAAAVCIGLFGPLLVILQSAVEAAFLRILGVTKKRTRCMLMFEQIALSMAGVIFATGAFALYDPGRFVRGALTFAFCYALYLLGGVCGAALAAVQVTRHKVLELLQVKG